MKWMNPVWLLFIIALSLGCFMVKTQGANEAAHSDQVAKKTEFTLFSGDIYTEGSIKKVDSIEGSPVLQNVSLGMLLISFVALFAYLIFKQNNTSRKEVVYTATPTDEKKGKDEIEEDEK